MKRKPEINRQASFRIAIRRYPAFERAIREQWKSFQEKGNTSLHLEIESFEVQELEQHLLATDEMREGAWDVCFVSTDWVAAIHQRAYAADLRPMLETAPPQDWPGGWAPSLLRLQSLQNVVLGLPYHDGPECLILRKDLFEDETMRGKFSQTRGRELQPPRTWEEFHELARFFQYPDSRLYGTAFAALPDGHNSVYDFLLQLWTRGGNLISDSGEVRCDTSEVRAALEFYRCILTDRGAVHPDCRTMDSVRAGASFAAGELAMMVNWFGFATAAHTDEHSRVRGKVTVAPIPSEAPGQSVTLNVYWLLSIAAGSPHTATAWEFLRHVASPEMDRLTTISGAIGCRRSTWDDPEVNRVIPFYCQMDELHRHAREIPQRDDWPKIANIIDELVTRTVATNEPIPDLLRDVQGRFDSLTLRKSD